MLSGQCLSLHDQAKTYGQSQLKIKARHNLIKQCGNNLAD